MPMTGNISNTAAGFGSAPELLIPIALLTTILVLAIALTRATWWPRIEAALAALTLPIYGAATATITPRQAATTAGTLAALTLLGKGTELLIKRIATAYRTAHPAPETPTEDTTQ